MGKHLQRDLDLIKKDILTMGAMVEDATNKAISAFLQRREDLANELMAGDEQSDQKESAIEDECLKTLALHHPVAGDLRFVVMVLKVNHDLERMGDLAANMAERTLALLRDKSLDIKLPIQELGESVRMMVRHCLDALVNLDAKLARKVCEDDDSVDRMHREMFVVLEQKMRADSSSIERATGLLSLSRYLERIADHATNIAEDVVYLVEGDIIRHQFADDGDG